VILAQIAWNITRSEDGIITKHCKQEKWLSVLDGVVYLNCSDFKKFEPEQLVKMS
jgi:cytochrome b involved in lipid metabolism